MFVHGSSIIFIVLCFGPLLISTQTVLRMIPAVLGSSVTLDCTVSPSPNSFMIWEKTNPTKTFIAINDKLQTGFQNSPKVSIHVRADNSTSLELKSMGLAEDGEYRCYDVIDMLSVDRFDVTILVRPFDIGVSSLIGQIDEGTQQTITCTADGGKPSPSIEWYLLGPDVNRTKLIGNEDAKQYPNGTWYKRSSLTFTVTRQMYRGALFCLVNTGPIPFYNESFQTQLDVNLSPIVPTIGYFTGLFNNGETKTITCTSAGSRPAATINWYIDNTKLSNTIHEVLPRSDGTFFVTGIISVTFDKSMSGRHMRCAASNSVVQNNGVGEVNRSITLLVTYSPEITSENGTREVTEDSDIVLTCLVDARPMPIPQNIFWRHNNKMISTGTGSRFNYTASRVADLHISSVKREDAGDYMCQALNTIGVGTGQKVHIDVSYRPFCTQGGVVKHAVKLGGSVTVTCTVDGNPGNSTIKWRYKGTGITINPRGSARSVYGRPREITSTAVISVMNDWQYTDVECLGTNAIGVSRSPCLYRIVRPGPPEVPTNCSWSSLNEAEIQVQCNPGFDGGSGQFFVLQQSESGSQYDTILNDTTAMFLASNLKSGTRYSFKICATSDLYPELLSCSSEIAAQTSTGSNGQQALASAGSPNSAPYIAAGVMGAVVLFILIGIIIFFIRKRRQPEKEREESCWNQNNLPDTSQPKQGGARLETGTSNGSGIIKNTNTFQNSHEENSNNQFILADNKESFVMHINPNDTKNFDLDDDHSVSDKMQAYQVPVQQTQGYIHVEDISPMQTKRVDDFGVNDFQNWLNGTPLNFGRSSRHNLCYSEADIPMATTKPRSTSHIDDKKSVSLEVIPNTNDSKLNNTGLAFQAKPSSHFITMDNCEEQTESSGSSTGSINSKQDRPAIITTDTIRRDSHTEDSSRSSDSKNSLVKRSSYKLAIHNNDDFGLQDFFSASVEALAALDATLADDTSLGRGQKSDSSESFKSSSDNVDDQDRSRDQRELPEDTLNTTTEQKWYPIIHGGIEAEISGEQDYVEMSLLSGNQDQKETLAIAANQVCVDAISMPETYGETPTFPDKQDHVETATLPETYDQVSSSILSDKHDSHPKISELPSKYGETVSTEATLSTDYIDMSAIPCKEDNRDTNALYGKQGGVDSPTKSGPVEKIRLLCKRVKVRTPTPSVHDGDKDTSSSSESSSSSSSESDSEEFTTPKESRDLENVFCASSSQNSAEQGTANEIPFIDSGSDSDVKSAEKDSTSAVYF
ncbi:serine-rich adhesin for platelets-like [Pecten maximus]|uniref:serine-rich adhesin for platelets-like n=1 Tax=Pecten maximus TaxID=6579 RepID=UPI001458F4BF|nr:serine-rich adhesin for platelets-like [Pecten maximus]